MSQRDEVGIVECDETWVRFEWPSFQVRNTGTQKLRVNAEVLHGSYEVSFEVVELDDVACPRTICHFSLSINSLERMVKVARAQEGLQ